MILNIHRTPVIVLCVLLVIAVSISFALSVFAASSKLDFGDAPDGKRAYYGGVKTGGNFPSTEASDGARVQSTSTVWLGKDVSKEEDSLQVDRDTFDDGASLKLKSCSASTAVFYVQVKDPGQTSGTAYLNLYADWNKDGEWGGSDECAAEWAVRNYPIDLSEQTTAVEVYMPGFTAGKKIHDIWWRAMVTLDERVTNENGTGLYSSGEVEDYGPAVPGKRKKYGVKCEPSPLTIPHGGKGIMTIVERPGTTPFSFIDFPNSIDPNGDGKVENKMRRLEIVGADKIRVTSKKKHDVKLIEQRSVDVSVRYADGERIIVPCLYNIVHEDITGVTQHDTTYTRTEFSPSKFTVTSSSTSVIRTTITPAETISTEIVSMQISGIQIPFGDQHPALPDPADVDLNINGQGWPEDWTCEYDAAARVKTCQGSSTLMTGESSFDLFFNQPIDEMTAFHLLLIIPEGVMALDIPPGSNDGQSLKHPADQTPEQPAQQPAVSEPLPDESTPEEHPVEENIPEDNSWMYDPSTDPYSTYY